MGIDYTPGQVVTRAELNAAYGGGIQGGILTPSGGRYAFVFTDVESGHRFGYVWDGWADDTHRTFYYTGEGASGDQAFRRGGKNLVLAESLASAREIHLFEAVGNVPGSRAKKHCYLGQFQLNRDKPFRREDSVGADGELRSVIVFQFEAIGETAKGTPTDAVEPAAPPAVETRSYVVDVENDHGSFQYPVGAKEPTVAARIEMQLERSWQQYLKSQGHEVGRQRIRVAGQSTALTTDTWDATTGFLYEAKGSVARESVRMAVGQLLDYRRHIRPLPQGCFVLLPSRPAEDLVSLIAEIGFGLVYPRGTEFVEERPR